MTTKSKAGRDNIYIGGNSKKVINISNNFSPSVIIIIALFCFIIVLMKQNQQQNQLITKILSSIKPGCLELLTKETEVNSSPGNTLDNLLMSKNINSSQNPPKNELDEMADHLPISDNPEVSSYFISDVLYPTTDFLFPFTEADHLKSEFSPNPLAFSETNIDNSIVANNNIFSKAAIKAVTTDRNFLKTGFASIKNLTVPLSNKDTVADYGLVTTPFNSSFSLTSANHRNTTELESFPEEAEINTKKKVALPDMNFTGVGISVPIVKQFAINQETSDTGSDSKSESKSIPENTSLLSILILPIVGGILRLKMKID
ncbi:MAG: hypothetical protein F6J92_23020 [Symploca sp. SIO1A3]|nr:hypothetical protein [Symploca sp. SIO1A3]